MRPARDGPDQPGPRRRGHVGRRANDSRAVGPRELTPIPADDPRTTARAVAAALTEALGPDLVAVYLHGSAVLGGFIWQRSDLDILALGRVALSAGQVEAIGSALAPLDYPAKGLELTLMTVEEAATPELRAPRFQVHVATGGPDGAARVMDGRGRAGDPDLVLQIAVCREYAEAIVGPPAAGLLGEIPEQAVRNAMRAEIAWGRANAPLEYLVLTAARAWLFFVSGRIGSKIEAGEWAAGRDPEPAVIQTALARQRGAEMMVPEDAAHRFADRVERLLGPAASTPSPP